MTERAYSTIAVKSLDADERTFSGLATSPVADRINDCIDPMGCRYRNPTILLRAHDHQSPIGEVHFGRPSKAGIGFRARIPTINEPGLLKDRVDMAWGEIKHGLIKAVSIGFMPTKPPTPNEKGGLDYSGVEIFELSTVAVPAQSLATIDSVKAIDAAVLRGEGPVQQRSLWERIGRLGLDALNEAETNTDLKALGNYGLAVATARSSQAMLRAICEHIDQLERRT